MFDRQIRFVRLRILRTSDSPHKIALGVALGIFVAWMPPLGYHILLALALTFLLQANKFFALVCVWVSNPFTYIPICYMNYVVGRGTLRWYFGEPRLDPAKALFLHQPYAFGSAQF